MFQCRLVVNGIEKFFPVSSNPFIGRSDTVCCAVEQSMKNPYAIVEAFYGSTKVCTYRGGVRDDLLEDKSIQQFEAILVDDYGEELNDFWKQQYEMFESGHRGVMLHDTTLVALS